MSENKDSRAVVAFLVVGAIGTLVFMLAFRFMTLAF